MKWNVSVLRRSGECERTEVADFELSEFFNRIASAEGKAWVLSVERVGDVGDSALDGLVERQRVRVIGTAAVPDVTTALVNIVCVGVRPPVQLLAHGFKALAFGRLHGNQGCYGHVKLPSSNHLKVR